jgi:hypothetical protein
MMEFVGRTSRPQDELVIIESGILLAYYDG